MSAQKFISSLLSLLVLTAAVRVGAVTVTNMAAGGAHSVVLKSDGSFWLTGYNFDGELGDGSTNNRLAPELLLSNGVTAIAGGYYHTLFVKSDGSLWAMGYNAYGELGDGSSTNHYTPEEIVPNGVVAVAGGGNHSLFIKTDGSLWAMGHDNYGQLGDGTNRNELVPEEIIPSGVVAIAAGQFHSLFIKSDGSLWAMGENNAGQLGDGTTTAHSTPEEIVASNVVAISTRDSTSLFLKSDGSLWGMGSNNYYELGNKSTANVTTPIEITNGVIAMASGSRHSVFVKSDGSLWGMGDNSAGQIGMGEYIAFSSVPAEITSNVTAVAAGIFHTLFLRSDGTLWGMGFDFDGPLGDATGLIDPFVVYPELINAVSFSNAPLSGIQPLPVQFSAPALDIYGTPITNWNWSFGDQTSGTGQTTSHVYLAAGTFSPLMMGTNSLGAPVGGAGLPVSVLPNFGQVVNGGFETGNYSGWSFPSNQNGAIIATATNYVHSGSYGAELGPVALSYMEQTLNTTPGASYILSFWLRNNSGANNQFLVEWNGNTLADLQNIPPGPWSNYVFTVTATSASTVLEFGYDNGPSYFGLDDITVLAPVVPSSDVTSGPFPLTVHFSSPSQDANGQTITNWDWSFGDGTPNSALQNPTHTYMQVGTFSTSLLAGNSQGQFAGGPGPAITVTQPTLQYTASPTNGAAPLTVQFTSPPVDSGGSPIVNWIWDFGDGSPISTNQSTSHTYRTQGAFTVSLIAYNSYDMQPIVSGPSMIDTTGLVSNYSFELYNSASGLPIGWSVGTTNSGTAPLYVDQEDAHTGTNSLLFYGTGFASQNLSTEPGEGYLVSFWISRPRYDGSEQGDFAAYWNSNTIFYQSASNADLSDELETNVQCYVTATSTNALLEFQSWPDPAECQIFLDDVSVTPAEVEPAAITPASGPLNLNVHFTSSNTDTAGQTITAWNWDFGDGSPPSALQDPSHTYTNVGTFTVVLWATNSLGTPVPGSTLVVSPSLPTVAVNAGPTNGAAPLTVQFTAASTDNSGLALTNWNWSFGDGTTGGGPNPAHTFYADSGTGQFQPTLIGANSAGVEVIGIVPSISVVYNGGAVTNGGFETGDFTDWTAVGNVSISANAYSGSHSAEFGPTAGSLSQTIATTPGAGYVLDLALESYAGAANGLSILWDGTVIFGQTNAMAMYQWTNLAFFVLATNTNSTLQFVYTPTGNSYIQYIDDVSLEPLEIEPFSAIPIRGAIPLTVRFNASATDSAGRTITNWNWDFGDGSPQGAGQSPSHVYSSTGTFVPVLTATAANGATIAGASGPLIVTKDIAFAATPSNGPTPLIVQFAAPGVDSNGRTITNWSWSFGDGTTSTAQNPIHVYQGVATFTPTLVATNNAGAALAGIGPVIAVNSGIISNGGFETGDFTGWTLPDGQSAMAVDSLGAHTGNYGVELANGSLQSLTQSLSTIPGETYLLSFWLLGNGGGIGEPNNQFDVQWGGNMLMDITNTPLLGWTNFQFGVVASSTNTLLEFDFDNAPTFFGLDDISALPAVSFTATPTNGIAPLTVRFNGPGTDTTGATITNWSWAFGDGGFSSVQNPSHTYTIQGGYQPLLVMLNSAGVAEAGISRATILVGAPPNLVTNGGFETGNFNGWSFSGSGGVGSISTSPNYVHSGSYGAELGPTSLEYMSQTLSTTPGQTYTLSFWLRNNSGANNEFLVEWNGDTLTNMVDISSGAWTDYVFTVTAATSSTVLEFGCENGPSYFGLDDISVIALSSPSLGVIGVDRSGQNLVINATNGASGASYVLLTTTNLALPFSQWTPLLTNNSGVSGNFNFTITNAIGFGPARFFIISQ